MSKQTGAWFFVVAEWRANRQTGRLRDSRSQQGRDAIPLEEFSSSGHERSNNRSRHSSIRTPSRRDLEDNEDLEEAATSSSGSEIEALQQRRSLSDYRRAGDRPALRP